ncbi:MAG: tRNA lysidine(34) synthetase TilS [Sphingomonas sp.]
MIRPDPGLVARFRTDLESLTGQTPTSAGPLAVAVSGGADSVAMLLLAAAAWPDAVRVATVDHGLRAESVGEARSVAGMSAALGVPHATLSLPPGWNAQGNLQEQAREARYAALASWANGIGARWVAVAHQRDDVAETFLMRARRGAGVGGLAAMRPVRSLGEGVGLVRPLLGWARCELERLVREAGLTAAHDPSNGDPRFDRSRMRALIAATPDLLAQRLAHSATTLRDAEEALVWATDREAALRLRLEGGEAWLDPADLPRELCRRLAHRAIDHVRCARGADAPWRDQGLDRLIAMLGSGSVATIAGVQARALRGLWHFRPAPPHRSH